MEISTIAYLQWHAGREFNRRLKKKFDAFNIELLFPHVTLDMIRTNRDNQTRITLSKRKVAYYTARGR